MDFLSGVAYANDGEIKKIDDSDIFEISNVSFLDELLGNYMAIYELKCALRAIEEYDVDYYMFDGSILGDLQNAFPRGAKLPSKLRDNLDDVLLNEFERRLKLKNFGLVFPDIRDTLKLMESPKKENLNKIEEYNLHLASIEKIILLREVDPDFNSPVSDNLVYQNFPAILFGFPLMILATMAPGKPMLSMGILIAYFIVLNIILFRSKIFKKKEK